MANGQVSFNEFFLSGVQPTKSAKHTLRDCTENEEL
jgi:hypothetical protein